MSSRKLLREYQSTQSSVTETGALLWTQSWNTWASSSECTLSFSTEDPFHFLPVPLLTSFPGNSCLHPLSPSLLPYLYDNSYELLWQLLGKTYSRCLVHALNCVPKTKSTSSLCVHDLTRELDIRGKALLMKGSLASPTIWSNLLLSALSVLTNASLPWDVSLVMPLSSIAFVTIPNLVTTKCI